jgi:hypothetical protein
MHGAILSFPQYAIMAWYLVKKKHRNNFTFTFTFHGNNARAFSVEEPIISTPEGSKVSSSLK